MELGTGRRTGYVWESIYGWHDPGTGHLLPSDVSHGLQPAAQHMSHPDTKRRAHELIEVTGLIRHLTRIPAVPIHDSAVSRVHSERYISGLVRDSQNNGGDMGDGISKFGRHGIEIAKLATGGAYELLKAVINGEVDNGYALIHPPGHHAEPDTGMGFCMLNNVAVCAESAITELGLSRVAIVDIDVHHGNGAEKIFWERKDVLHISIHQDRNFPHDTGMASSRGVGNGFGYNLNIPMLPGCGNGAYLYALDNVIVPALKMYKPDVILVASGVDPNTLDPLAAALVTADGFAEIAARLMVAAEESCSGRIVFIQEGGYSPAYVPICIHRIVETLAGKKTLAKDPYAGIFSHQYGQELESWQKNSIDSVIPLVADIRPATDDAPTVVE